MSKAISASNVLDRKSKLEGTIISNRTMNLELAMYLSCLENERRRRLIILLKEQKVIRAEAKIRKDEKFRIMLQNQNKKSKRKVNRSNVQRPDINKKSGNNVKQSVGVNNTLNEDIESALFTSGIVNAPGVNNRMRRLQSRTRILPHLEEGGAGAGDGSDIEEDSTHNENKQNMKPECKAFITEDVTPILDQSAVKLTRHSDCHGSGRNHQDKPAPRSRSVDSGEPRHVRALVRMTSGLTNLITDDALLKPVKEDEYFTMEVPANLHSTQRPVTSLSAFRYKPRPPSNGMEWAGMLSLNHSTKKKNVKFIPKSESFAGVIKPETAPLQSRRKLKGNELEYQSRLSIIKTKIASDEHEYLQKLRHKSQLIHNEQIYQKVWDFIGRRPLSSSSSVTRATKDEEVLSTEEDNLLKSRFAKVADVTA